jgi:hypothetical protein
MNGIDKMEFLCNKYEVQYIKMLYRNKINNILSISIFYYYFKLSSFFFAKSRFIPNKEGRRRYAYKSICERD